MTTDTRRPVTTARIVQVRAGTARTRRDALTGEEPLEIRALGPGQEAVRVAVTMRTPGHDFALAVGFLITEGLIAPGDVAGVAYCDEPDARHHNVVTVRTRAPFDLRGAERNFFAASSCGICGKAALESLEVRCPPVPGGPVVGASAVTALPERLRAAQAVFDRTGGLHAAGLFDATGVLLRLREDVGRHNAVDKIVGADALDGACGGAVLLVSGRLSFEIVQKAAVAGIPVVCAVSAPSDLAVRTAEALGITAIGFLRGEGFNIYSRPERIAVDG